MITTNYGSWPNHTRCSLSPESDVNDYMGGGDRDWIERMGKSGAIDAITNDYREAVRSLLPSGLYLVGNEFHGLHHTDRAYTDGLQDFDISAAIESIDLAAIVEKHDIDLQGNQ